MSFIYTVFSYKTHSSLSDDKRPCLSAGGEPESEIWDLLAGSAEAEKLPQAVSPRWSGHGKCLYLNRNHSIISKMEFKAT